MAILHQTDLKTCSICLAMTIIVTHVTKLTASVWILLGNAVSAVGYVFSANARFERKSIAFAYVASATMKMCYCKDLSKSGNYYCPKFKRFEFNCGTICPVCNLVTWTFKQNNNHSTVLPQTLQAIGTTSSGISNQGSEKELVMAGIIV